MTRSLSLFGEYDVGKTHFGGQLLGRLNQEKGALRMVGAPSTLEPFENVLASINSGRAAAHTPQNQYVESIWPLADADGRTVELVWPDYGGEQLSTIRAQRSMPREWRKRVVGSAGWIVMLRIAHTQLSDDIFTRPLSTPGTERQATEQFRVSPQAQLVDFLQWLMFMRGTGTLDPVSAPPLMLLLSCWDELPSAERDRPPIEILRDRAPMVAAFAESNWLPDALKVMGLSALERSLREDAVDEGFVDEGPEAFGYVVLPDGRHDHDLTLAIAAMI
jgi:hypothetical protein